MDLPPPLWSGGPGPASGERHSFPAPAASARCRTAASNAAASDLPTFRSQYPITTGSSVFGLKFNGGVVVAADTLGSYGSLARFPSVERVARVNSGAVVACTGDYADFQLLREILEQKQVDADVRGGKENMRPSALHCWLTRFLYARRSRFDPLWTTMLVAGVESDGAPFLGLVNHIGTAFTEECLATGLGADIAVPIMRDAIEKKGGADKLTEAEAREVVERCLRVCFLRDCRASARFHLAVVSKEGAVVEEPRVIDSDWEVARVIKGYE